MAVIPAQLPKFVLLDCKRLQSEFDAEEQWAVVREAVNEASSAGLDPNAVLTLMVGVRACEKWRKNPVRLALLKNAQEQANRNRGNASFKRRANERDTYTVDFLERVITLLVLGYIAENRVKKVHRRHWYPIARATFRVFQMKEPEDEEPDYGARVVAAIDQRLRRFRRKYDMELPRNKGAQLFKELYATLTDVNPR